MVIKVICRTPKEAWILLIRAMSGMMIEIEKNSNPQFHPKDETGEEKISRKEEITRHHAELVGYLYLAVRQMQKHQHPDVAAKIQQLLDMLTDLNITDPAARDAIQKKHGEINPIVAEGKAELELMGTDDDSPTNSVH